MLVEHLLYAISVVFGLATKAALLVAEASLAVGRAALRGAVRRQQRRTVNTITDAELRHHVEQWTTEANH